MKRGLNINVLCFLGLNKAERRNEAASRLREKSSRTSQGTGRGQIEGGRGDQEDEGIVFNTKELVTPELVSINPYLQNFFSMPNVLF